MPTAAATTLIIQGLALGAAGYGAARAMTPKPPKAAESAPIPLPQAPSPEAAGDKARAVIKNRRAAMTQSIYTSPLGVAGEAQVVRKTLLGQ